MISLHIRAVGHWTNKLYEHFLEQEAKVHFKSVNSSSDSKYESFSMTKALKIREQARRTSLGVQSYIFQSKCYKKYAYVLADKISLVGFSLLILTLL